MRRLVLVLLVAILATTAGGAARGAGEASGPFAGLGTWIDVYDAPVYRNPEATAARIAARGVRTVYVETANDRSTTDVVNPDGIGQLLDALHASNVQVVGWYLPGFVKPALDLRRTRALLTFRSPAGGAFDGVALDVEALRLRRVGLRTQRLITLAGTLDAEAGELPIAAITYPGRAFERHVGWWPGFPWAALMPFVDAFIPMTYTGGGFHGYDATYGYVARSLRLLRAAVGAGRADSRSGWSRKSDECRRVAGIRDAVSDDGTVSGWSLYDWQTTGPRGWRRWARSSRRLVARGSGCGRSLASTSSRRSIRASGSKPSRSRIGRDIWPACVTSTGVPR